MSNLRIIFQVNVFESRNGRGVSQRHTSGSNLYISIMATSLPMHPLAPVPNVNCAASSSKVRGSLTIHLSGLNSLASSPYNDLSRCTAYGWLVTSTPPGMKCPSMTLPPLGTTLANICGAGGRILRLSLIQATMKGSCKRVSSY